MTSPLPSLLRRRLEMNVRRRNVKVGIALSGGVDSCSVLAACLRQGMSPVIFSYTPETHESTDHQYARINARNLGLRFVSVPVAMNVEGLEALARTVISFGFRTKMQVESLAPMVEIARRASTEGVNVLLTGDQADGYYINGNWISRNYDRSQGIPGPQRQHVKEDQDCKRIDVLRGLYWEEDRGNCGPIMQICASVGVRAVMPYRDERVAALFAGTHWREVNEPRLKEPAWQAFPDMTVTRGVGGILVREKPVNLHRGDSMFSETMGRKLLEAYPGYRSPLGVYGAMARGEV